MKIFNTALILGLLFRSLVVCGQNLDYERTSINYTVLPTERLPSDILTYKPFVIVNSSRHIKTNVINDSLPEKLLFPGLEKVDSNYDLEVTLVIGNMNIISESRQTRFYEGGIKDEKPFFYYYYQYKMPISLRLRTYSGQVIFRCDTLSGDITWYRETDQFDERDKVDQYWATNRDKLLTDSYNRMVERAINDANNLIASKYAYRQSKFVYNHATVKADKKSKFDYSPFPTALAKLKEGFALRRTDSILSGSTQIKEAIGIWENEVQSVNLNDKKARIDKKVAYAIHLNLAGAYLWLFNFEKAKWHINEAGKLKGKPDDNEGKAKGLMGIVSGVTGVAKEVRGMVNFWGGDVETMKVQIDSMAKLHAGHPDWNGKRPTTKRSGQPIIYQFLDSAIANTSLARSTSAGLLVFDAQLNVASGAPARLYIYSPNFGRGYRTNYFKIDINGKHIINMYRAERYVFDVVSLDSLNINTSIQEFIEADAYNEALTGSVLSRGSLFRTAYIAGRMLNREIKKSLANGTISIRAQAGSSYYIRIDPITGNATLDTDPKAAETFARDRRYTNEPLIFSEHLYDPLPNTSNAKQALAKWQSFLAKWEGLEK